MIGTLMQHKFCTGSCLQLKPIFIFNSFGNRFIFCHSTHFNILYIAYILDYTLKQLYFLLHISELKNRLPILKKFTNIK